MDQTNRPHRTFLTSVALQQLFWGEGKGRNNLPNVQSNPRYISLWHYTNLQKQKLRTNILALNLRLLFPGAIRAVAIYPLNGGVKGRDISLSRNPTGILGNVRTAPGPDRTRDGSYQFFGRSNSFIQFPNRGKIDTKRSITLMAWIYHEGRAGPIFNYMPNGWGVHFWMISPRMLFVRFTRRRGRRFTKAVLSRRVRPHRWQLVAATYNHKSGQAKLFVQNRFVTRKDIGRIRLATNYPARMGARIGDKRYFRGRISCMQVYPMALTAKQINARKKRCFRKGETKVLTRRDHVII